LLNALNLTSNANLTGVLSLPEKLQNAKPEVSSEDLLPVAIIAIFVAFSLLAIICAVLTYKCYFRPKIKERKRRARDGESCDNGEYAEEPGSIMSDGAHSSIDSMPTHMKSLFGSKKLRITGNISKGGFGVVYKGVFEGKDVAVKRIIAPEKKKAKLKLARMFGMSFLCLPQSMKQQP
jgi:hypothetical protein